MLRWVFALLSLSLVFLSSVSGDQVVSSKNLRISIRNNPLQDAPSCQHRIAQVELLNVHPTDPISITSIQTTKERTEPQLEQVNLQSDTDDRDSANDDVAASFDLPQQFHVSKLPGGSLELGPGQHAIIPLAFIPRFPTFQPHCLQNVVVESTFVEADWRELMDADGTMSHVRPRRSNLASHSEESSASPHPVATDDDSSSDQSRYRVVTTLLVETAFGPLELPVEASSVRENLFGIPDVIFFDVAATPQRDSAEGALSETGELSYEQKVEKNHGGNRNANDSIFSSDGTQPVQTGSSAQEVGNRTLPSPTARLINDSLVSPAFIIDQIHLQKSTNGTHNADPFPDDSRLPAVRHGTVEDCYDVYLRNPATGVLHVLEVALSRSKGMTLYKYQRDCDKVPDGQQEIIDWNASSASEVDSDARSDSTVLNIPPDGRKHYVVTVCSVDRANTSSSPSAAASLRTTEASGWFDARNEETSIGFLEIKTTLDTLFIGLESKNSSRFSQALAGDLGDSVEVSPNDREIYSEDVDDGFTLNSTRESTESDKNMSPCNGEINPGDEPFLRINPAYLELFLLSSAHKVVEHTIQIENALPRPVTIMRVAVAVERYKKTSNSPETVHIRQMGLSIVVSQFDDILASTLESGQAVNNAVTLKCVMDWEKFLIEFGDSTSSVDVRGAIILRGTSRVDWSLQEWERAIKAGAHGDDWNLVVEVPFTVAVRYGRVEIVVQASTHVVPSFWAMQSFTEDFDVPTHAFFPLDVAHTTLAIDDEYMDFFDVENVKGIDHKLRVVSSLDVDLVIDSVEIVSKTSAETPFPVLCSRFDAYIVERGPSDQFNTGNLTNLGLTHIRYRYPGNSALENEKKSGVFNRSQSEFPNTCYFRYKTEPDSGMHELPFVVYSGNLHVSADSDVIQSSYKDDPNGVIDRWHDSIVGLDGLLHWFKHSECGRALRSILRDDSERGSDVKTLLKYFSGLANTPMKTLHPILLEAGAIGENEAETLQLYFTNYNPVPISLIIEVGEIEGLNIAVGRDEARENGDGNSVLDLIPNKLRTVKSSKKRNSLVKAGRFKGHPVDGLRQFLLTNDLPRSYLDLFPFRDDVTLSHRAASKLPILQNLFRSYAVARFHRSSKPLRLTETGWNRCDKLTHPPLYGSFSNKFDKKPTGPIIISNDRKSVRHLAVCWDADGVPDDEKSDGTSVLLPPGGVARFDVTLRSPESAALEKDITQFLLTGLLLSTDHGELLPVLVSFEALQGTLELSAAPSPQQSQVNDDTIQVQAGLFLLPSSTVASAIQVPPHVIPSLSAFSSGESIIARDTNSDEKGVSLYMKSSFLNNVQLREITTCNPWFEVELVNETSMLEAKDDPFLGVHIGKIRSVVACLEDLNDSSGTARFPSFYRCVLKWMENKNSLQPRGCGPTNTEYRKDSNDFLNFSNRNHTGSTIQIVKEAVFASEWTDGDDFLNNLPAQHFPTKSGRRIDGFVTPTTFRVFSNAWSALQIALEAGALSVGTSLRAVVEYNTTHEDGLSKRTGTASSADPPRFLSVATRNTTVSTLLNLPRLLRPDGTFVDQTDSVGVLNFPATPVANVASLLLPIRNPTAVSIRVRLAVLPANTQFLETYSFHTIPPYVQRKAQSNIDYDDLWWNQDGAFCHHDNHGNLICAKGNSTKKGGCGSERTARAPSQYSTNAFVVGCYRCGLRNDLNNKLKKNTNGKTASINVVPSFSTFGASAAYGKVLRTLPSSSPLKTQSHGDQTRITAEDALLHGGSGTAAFALPYSALDEVIIPPFSESKLGPILFRPPGRTHFLGCTSANGKEQTSNCESQLFDSTLFVENSLTGLEKVELRGKSLWENVVFLDSELGGFGDLESRHGRAALLFRGIAKSQGDQSTPKIVVVHNDGDMPVTITSGYLTSASRNLFEGQRKKKLACELNGFHLLECGEGLFPFVLKPQQNRSIFIEYRPHCAKQKDFISLRLEVESAKRTNVLTTSEWPHRESSNFQRQLNRHEQGKLLQQHKAELMLGYEMTDEEIQSCLTFSPSYATLAWFNFGRSNRNSSTLEFKSRRFRTRTQIILSTLFSLILVAWLISYRKDLESLLHSIASFQSAFNASGCASSEQKDSSPNSPHWSSAFRCTCRDPTSSDLQSFAREQTRQMVLTRFNSVRPKTFHRTLPSLDTSHGRQHIPTAPIRQAISAGTGMKNTAKIDRVRTSDSIFSTFDPHSAGEAGILPLQLGWRIASSRGVMEPFALKASPVHSKVDELLCRRRHPPSSVVRRFADDSNSTSDSDYASDLSSSFDGNDPGGKHAFQPEVVKSATSKLSHNLVKVENLRNESKLVTENDTSAKNSDRLDGIVIKNSDSPINKFSHVKEETRIIQNSLSSSDETNKGSDKREMLSNIVKADVSPSVLAVTSKPREHEQLASAKPRPLQKDELPKRAKSVSKSAATDTSKKEKQRKKKSMSRKNVTKKEKKSESSLLVSSVGKEKDLDPPTSALPQVSETKPGSSKSLRPPPGLLPPPGFGVVPVSPTSSPIMPPMQTALNFPSDDDAFASRPPSTGASTIDNFSFSTTNIKEGSKPSIPPGDLLLGVQTNREPFAGGMLEARPQYDAFQNSMADFDVMDFLDGILGETGLDELTEGEHSNLAATATTSPMLLPINPWAVEKSGDVAASRAAAYGISFEESTSERTQNSAGFPLLTPAALLSPNPDNEEEKDIVFKPGHAKGGRNN